MAGYKYYLHLLELHVVEIVFIHFYFHFILFLSSWVMTHESLGWHSAPLLSSAAAQVTAVICAAADDTAQWKISGCVGHTFRHTEWRQPLLLTAAAAQSSTALSSSSSDSSSSRPQQWPDVTGRSGHPRLGIFLLIKQQCHDSLNWNYCSICTLLAVLLLLY